MPPQAPEVAPAPPMAPSAPHLTVGGMRGRGLADVLDIGGDGEVELVEDYPGLSEPSGRLDIFGVRTNIEIVFTVFKSSVNVILFIYLLFLFH